MICTLSPVPGKMLVVLRDGRKLHGVLRSYDQFGKFVLVKHTIGPLTLPTRPLFQLTSSSKTPSSEYFMVKHSQNTGTASFSYAGRMSCCLAKLYVFERRAAGAFTLLMSLGRISIRRMMSHYNKWIIPFLIHIIRGISRIRRHAKISNPRSYMSRKGSVRRVARAMAIDGLSY